MRMSESHESAARAEDLDKELQELRELEVDLRRELESLRVS